MSIFTKEEQEQIKAAIGKAENQSSGEIRLCIEKHCPEEILDRAAWFFDKLHMQKTQARNGVLIYIAYADHQFAIIGDQGINAVVEDDFWDETKDTMVRLFKENQLTAGIIAGIEKAGAALGKYFPSMGKDDVNELPDDIVFGKEDEKK